MKDKILYVGADKEIITPPIGTCLCGYIPDLESTSVHDDLTSSAVVFSDGETKAVLISITVCEIEDELVERIQNGVFELTNIPQKNVIVAVTHTHSGPITKTLDGWGELDHKYCDEIMIPQTLKAVKTAYDALKPAKLGVATTESLVGINRRELDRNAHVLFGQNPWGIIDKTMTVLSFKGLEDDVLIVNLIHYGCHGTAAGRSREISRDWAGVMEDILTRESKATSIFINGNIGDVGPRITNGDTVGRGNMAYVMELGAIGGTDAVRAYRSIKEYRERIDLNVINGEIHLPYKKLPTLDEVNAELKDFDGIEPDKIVNIDRLRYSTLMQTKAFIESGKKPETERVHKQTIVTVGPVAFVPFQYEIFSEIGMRLCVHSKYQYTLCMSYANGSYLYLPSEEQICRGGYEVDCFKYGGVFRLADNTDTNIINENLRLMENK